jgi:hypothetical protein
VAERSTISQSVQIGVEATPGTAVAATRRLGSLGFSVGVQTEVSARRPIGQKYASLQVLGKEWSEADLEGGPVYTELPYLFASLLSEPTVTQVMGEGAVPTGAYRWVFDTSTFGEDNPTTFTLEQGSGARAHRLTNGIITDFDLSWGREEIEIGGTLLGRAIEDGITLTPNPTGLAQIPVKPTDLSVYLDSSAGTLGTTKLLRALSGEVSLGSRYAPLWVVDRDQPSFVTTIEGEPELEFTVVQMADQQGMENLLALRGGATRFLRLEAVGPVIFGSGAGAVRHSMAIDIAGQVSEVGEFSDEDGVYAVEWTFGGVHNPEWGKAMHVEVVTTTATL